MGKALVVESGIGLGIARVMAESFAGLEGCKVLVYGQSLHFTTDTHKAMGSRLARFLADAGMGSMLCLFQRPKRRGGRHALALAGYRGPWREHGAYRATGSKRSLRRRYGKRGSTV